MANNSAKFQRIDETSRRSCGHKILDGQMHGHTAARQDERHFCSSHTPTLGDKKYLKHLVGGLMTMRI